MLAAERRFDLVRLSSAHPSFDNANALEAGALDVSIFLQVTTGITSPLEQGPHLQT